MSPTSYQYGTPKRMIIVGGWCLSVDWSNQFIGRQSTPTAVVYAFLGLTAEHFRPDAWPERHERHERYKAIRKWQKIRNRIWKQSLRAVRRAPDDDFETIMRRRKKFLRSRYELEAGDARALGEWVPALSDLQRQVHVEADTIR